MAKKKAAAGSVRGKAVRAAARRPAAKGAKAPAPAKGPNGMTLEEFRRIPAFSGMAERDAAAFLGLMEERPVARGEPVFREGEAGEGLFVILRGSVSIGKKNAKGGEREVAVLEKNEVFGEMDLISDRPHTAGAKGAESTLLLFLPRAEFRRLLQEGNPGATSMVIYFARTLAGRLDEQNRHMMEILDREGKPQATSEFADFKRRLLREWAF